ncbi:MAG: hypothetical protein U9N36_08165 [Euryarchaeota archaeon]|nr:hypothetical protein [Euryarchaeota archaeon]
MPDEYQSNPRTHKNARNQYGSAILFRVLGPGMPVLCVHSSGANVSAMMLGNPNLQGRVREYESLDNLEQILYEFAGALGEGRRQ